VIALIASRVGPMNSRSCGTNTLVMPTVVMVRPAALIPTLQKKEAAADARAGT